MQNLNEKSNLSCVYLWHEMMFKWFLAGNLKRSFVKIFSEKLLGETLCKLYQIFPPKVLVYILKNFSWYLFENLMEIYLSNKRIEKLVLLVKQENKYHTRNILEFTDFHSIRDEVWNILAKKKKQTKRRMRILGACIFF